MGQENFRILLGLWAKGLVAKFQQLLQQLEDEVAEVGEEVVAASSRASALPKNLIAPLPYRITRGGVPEACCPFSRCTPKGGMEKTCLAVQ